MTRYVFFFLILLSSCSDVEIASKQTISETADNDSLARIKELKNKLVPVNRGLEASTNNTTDTLNASKLGISNGLDSSLQKKLDKNPKPTTSKIKVKKPN